MTSPFTRGSRLTSVLAMLVLLTGTLFSCQKEDSSLPTPATTQVLSASTTTPVLTQANADNTALTLTWVGGTNHDTQAAIDYTVQIAKQGTNFASPATATVSRGVYMLAYKTSDFNTLLIKTLGLPIGTAQALEVRVKSQEASNTQAPDYSNVVTLTATPYNAVTNLYIVGDATPNGWDINNPNQMTASTSNSSVFTYTGILKVGEFKMVAGKGDFNAPFYRPTVDHPALSATAVQYTAGNPDNKWQITTTGAYTVTLDISKLTVSIVPFAAPTQLWLVGDATVKGWDIGNATPMTVSPTDPTIFTYTGPFVAGEFKIATAKDFNAAFYRPTTDHPALSATAVQVSAGNPDNKWQITAATAGTHTITLNTFTMTISIQ
ncbi:MAG: SusE domain-containing protein [Janthinobacterium lividum]